MMKLLKGLFSSVDIDNANFKLHYRLTLAILLFLSISVACRQYFGTSISCQSRDDFSSDYLNNYCYIQSTFSIVEAWTDEVGVEIPYPGVTKNNFEKTQKFHYYYQWVSIVLLLQAIFFYLPRLIWKTLEAGRIEEILEELKHPKRKEEIKSSKIESLMDSVIEDFGQNRKYFACFLLAEFLNFVNVIGQMVFMDNFLGGGFLSYGFRVLQSDSDAAVRLFPKVTMCRMHRYGSSGDVQVHSAICLLPINAFNEKMYAFLWFWFVFLAAATGLQIIRSLTLLSPHIRYLSMVHTRHGAYIQRQDLKKVLKQRDVGDWFVIYLLSKNLGSVNFRNFMSILGKKTVKIYDMELLEE